MTRDGIVYLLGIINQIRGSELMSSKIVNPTTHNYLPRKKIDFKTIIVESWVNKKKHLKKTEQYHNIVVIHVSFAFMFNCKHICIYAFQNPYSV